MTTQEKPSDVKNEVKQAAQKVEKKAAEVKETAVEKASTVKEVVVEKLAKIEDQTVSSSEPEPAKEPVLETSEEKNKETVSNLGVPEQLAKLKQDLLQRIEGLKGLKGADLNELTAFVKSEINAVIEDLSKLGKELKQDVSEISLKHKEQLTETLHRSKEHTIEAWSKVTQKTEKSSEEAPKS